MRKLILLFVTVLFSFQVFAQPYDTIIVKSGWNIIGGLQTGTPPQIVNTVPPGIITSPYYGFNPGGGYFTEDTLKRGSGYWIKCSQDGIVIFGAAPPSFVCGINQVNYSGKLYNTVQIGSQCWLKENLDVGTMINGGSNMTNNGIIEKYCYNNDLNNCNTYGGLYQWDETMQYITTPGTQGICPSGWHIPTYENFQALSSAVGWDGNALKAVGQGSGGGAGTNTSGYSVLLAGYNYNGSFESIGALAYFETSTEAGNGAWHMQLFGSSSMIIFGSTSGFGFSIRCLKD